MTLNELLRMSHVKRWGIVNVARQQTVAEHSANVAHIALQLARAIEADEAGIAEWALMHDAPEAVIGDMPTPTRVRLRECGGGAALINLESSVGGAGYQGAYDRAGQTGRLLVKMADMIEALWFLTIEGRGAHAESVIALLHKQFTQLLSWPGVTPKLWAAATQTLKEITEGQR